MNRTYDDLFLKKHLLPLYNQSDVDKSKQFFNLNLNQNFKFFDNPPVRSFCKSNTYKSFDYTVPQTYQGNQNLWNNKSLKKDSRLKTLNNSILNHEIEKESNQMKNAENDCSNKNSSSSTLSLHIAAYENSVEAISDGLQSFTKNSVQLVASRLSALQDSFEFPRQMEGNESSSTPEIQQFTASQKLFSPNQSASLSHMQFIQHYLPNIISIQSYFPGPTNPSTTTTATMDSYGASSSSSINDLPGRIRKRRFSTARIQPTRIKKVMQSDEDIGRMVSSVPVAIGSAMEHFAEKLLENAQDVMIRSSSKTLAPSHIFAAIHRTDYLKSFLEPIVNNFGGGGGVTSSPSPVTTPTNGLMSRPFENISTLSLSSPMEEKFDLNSIMRDTAKSHLSSNLSSSVGSSSSLDEGKRRRGRPKKDEKPNFKILSLPNDQESSLSTVSSSSSSVNGSISKTKADLDSLLMPPPLLVPNRKIQPPQKVIIPRKKLISSSSNNSTKPSNNSTSSTTTTTQSTTTMVSSNSNDQISA